MILFDIGANRGEATWQALYVKNFDKVIALECAPKMYSLLARNFVIEPAVIPLCLAVSDSVGQTIEFYECIEDGLSTLNKDWLTSDQMRYNGKEFKIITATTCTIDWLAEQYGEPDLIKIDVEGAEWSVFRGMTKYHGKLAFEWVTETIEEHYDQLQYLKTLGYTKVGPQFIEQHLQEPKEWFSIDSFTFDTWINAKRDWWESEGWKAYGMHPWANAGMMWVK